MVYVSRKAYEEARQALREAVAIAEETRSMPVGQSVLEVAAGLSAELGEAERALRCYFAAEAAMVESGNPEGSCG